MTGHDGWICSMDKKWPWNCPVCTKEALALGLKKGDVVDDEKRETLKQAAERIRNEREKRGRRTSTTTGPRS